MNEITKYTFFRKGATASRGLPNGEFERRWEDSNSRPLSLKAMTLSAWPPLVWRIEVFLFDFGIRINWVSYTQYFVSTRAWWAVDVANLRDLSANIRPVPFGILSVIYLRVLAQQGWYIRGSGPHAETEYLLRLTDILG